MSRVLINSSVVSVISIKDVDASFSYSSVSRWGNANAEIMARTMAVMLSKRLAHGAVMLSKTCSRLSNVVKDLLTAQ